jgi:hypothetical protein
MTLRKHKTWPQALSLAQDIVADYTFLCIV